jgi:DNA polymerase III epsilon subunit-like protein
MNTKAPRRGRSPLLFLDLETGGLDAHSHEIVEVGAVLTSADGTVELGRLDSRVRPNRPERIIPCVRRINGYSEEEWGDAPPLGPVLAELVDLARGATLVGHNVCFDWGFILRGLREHGLAWSGNGRYLDTMALAPWAGRGLADRRLMTMAGHLGIPTLGAHCAIVDAATCREVFLRLAPPRLARLEMPLPDRVVRRSQVPGGTSWRPSRWRGAWLRWERRLGRRGHPWAATKSWRACWSWRENGSGAS